MIYATNGGLFPSFDYTNGFDFCDCVWAIGVEVGEFGSPLKRASVESSGIGSFEPHGFIITTAVKIGNAIYVGCSTSGSNTK